MEKQYKELSNRVIDLDSTMNDLAKGLKLLVAASKGKNLNRCGKQSDHDKTTLLLKNTIKFQEMIKRYWNPFSCFKFTNEGGNDAITSIDNVESTNKTSSVVDNIKVEDLKILHDHKNVTKSYDNFRKFDIVEDYSNHYHSDTSSSIRIDSRLEAWHIKIKKDLKDLENELPDGVFVRTYEGRIDLLTTIIIGPEGTPYHNGLFFFDICFPKGYPDTPPMVRYDSRGYCINPCLSRFGDVHSVYPQKKCCELERVKVWVAGTSNILTLLFYLHSLFNTRKPRLCEFRNIELLYNELEDLLYNEKAFIASLKTMVSIMKEPPSSFKDFVVRHFRNRAFDILKACEAYSDGVRIGCVVKGLPDEGNKGIFSITFFDDLDECIQLLVAQFTRIGVKMDGDVYLRPNAPTSLINDGVKDFV